MKRKHKNEIIEHLKFLITQAEERIKLVDTKASIIVAFYAVLLGSNKYFIKIISFYEISIGYCYLIVALLLISFYFLILTIRPVKKWGLIWDFKSKDNTKSKMSFWMESEQHVDDFSIKKIPDILSNYQLLLKEISKRRIVKYRNYRRSMYFLRIALFLLIPALLKIAIKSFYIVTIVQR